MREDVGPMILKSSPCVVLGSRTPDITTLRIVSSVSRIRAKMAGMVVELIGKLRSMARRTSLYHPSAIQQRRQL
jgi:hypothetical protein